MNEVVNKQEVCVVTIETLRFFDECQYSYLPLLNEVFGVYSSKGKAEQAVFDYFTNEFSGFYEIYLEDFDMDGNRLYYDLCFKHEDKEFHGHALYCIDFHLEYIE